MFDLFVLLVVAFGCFFAGGFCGIVAIASEFDGLAWLHLVLLCVLCLFSLLLLGLGLFVV